MLIRTALALLITSMAVSAQNIPIPVITSATTNADATEVTLEGAGFGSSKPVVKLVKTPLTVINYTSTNIVAQLPTGVLPGSYALTVANEDTHFSGLFVAAIAGAVPPPPVPNNTAVFLSNSSTPGESTYYQLIGSNTSTNLGEIQAPLPSACTVDSLIYQATGNPPSVITGTGPIPLTVFAGTATVFKNGAATSVQCSANSYAAPITSSTCSDANHTATFNVGDQIAVRITGAWLSTRTITAVHCR